MKSWFKNNYLLLSIILLGIIIRFLFLLKYGDFWDDEMFSFTYAQKAWPEGLIYWLWETNPPLHMLILKIWFFVFPATEFWTRIPSLIFGTATILAVYKLAKLIWDKNVALLSALFIALHSYNVFWSATARVYSLLMLLSSLSVYFFFKIFFYNSPNKKDKIFLAIINTLLLLTHLSAVLLIFTQALIIFGINYKKFFSWFRINLIPFIISASWLIPSFLIKRHNQLDKTWLLNIHYTFGSIVGPLINLIAGVQYSNLGLLIISVLLALVLVVSILQIKKMDIKYASLLTFVLFPIFVTALFKIWHVKMLIYTIPFWVIIIAFSLKKISPNKIWAGLLIFAICLPGIFTAYQSIPLTYWAQISDYIEKESTTEEKTAVVYSNFMLRAQIERYLNLPLKFYAFDLALDPGMSWDDLIIKKNYLFLQFPPDDIANWFIEKQLNQYDKIILLQGEYSYTVFLNEILEKNNFSIQKERTKANLSGNYYLSTYVKNDSTTTAIQ